jgi:hypothetical protein
LIDKPLRATFHGGIAEDRGANTQEALTFATHKGNWRFIRRKVKNDEAELMEQKDWLARAKPESSLKRASCEKTFEEKWQVLFRPKDGLLPPPFGASPYIITA